MKLIKFLKDHIRDLIYSNPTVGTGKHKIRTFSKKRETLVEISVFNTSKQ